MSCCGGNCGCGSGCKCGSGCGGCNMYPDLGYSGENNTTQIMIVGGLAPKKAHYEEGSVEMVEGAEHGCKCGDNCTCDPCNCN